MKYLAPIIVLVALAFVAEGTPPCYVRAVHVRQQAHYVAPVIATYQQHAYPVYSVGYNGSGELVDVVKQLIDDNKVMREQLIQAVQGSLGQGPGLLPLRESHPGEKVMQARCASCHDESTAKAKGGGVSLFKGGVFVDTPENVSASIGAAIEDGTMPKGGKLTDAEKLDLMRFLVVKPATASK